MAIYGNIENVDAVLLAIVTAEAIHIKGADGKDGAPGKDGTDGKDGTNGITPHIGDNGNWYIGSTDTGKPSRGEQGLKGDTGAAGPQGAPGKDGAPGADGAPGEKGDTGATGPQGPQGEQGPKGSTGPQGPQGDPGTPGTKGDPGTPGKDGEPGAKGDPGEKGDKGDPGAPGIYYGTTQPTGDTHPVWIDPGGDHADGGLLPVVTATDNGKFLRVVSGAWAAAEISSANGVSF